MIFGGEVCQLVAVGGGAVPPEQVGQKKRRENYEKPFSAEEFNITGTEKQVKYARDISQRVFDYADKNIARYEKLASESKREPTKRTYLNMANEVKTFKRELTQQYRSLAKTGREMKASDIIERQRSLDGDYIFRQWQASRRK